MFTYLNNIYIFHKYSGKGCPMLRVLGATLSTTENHVGATVTKLCNEYDQKVMTSNQKYMINYQ